MSSHAATSYIASELLSTDPDLVDLVEQFVAGLDQRIRLLEQALAGMDYDQLRRAAHQLKGTAGGYGYPALTRLAGVLEQRAAEKTYEACRSAFEELKHLAALVVVRNP